MSTVYSIRLPLSAEAFGRWLEENNATGSISCSLGKYNVRVNRHTMISYKETGNVGVRRSSDVEVSAYGDTIEGTLLAAMQKCMEEPIK